MRSMRGFLLLGLVAVVLPVHSQGWDWWGSPARRVQQEQHQMVNAFTWGWSGDYYGYWDQQGRFFVTHNRFDQALGRGILAGASAGAIAGAATGSARTGGLVGLGVGALVGGISHWRDRPRHNPDGPVAIVIPANPPNPPPPAEEGPPPPPLPKLIIRNISGVTVMLYNGDQYLGYLVSGQRTTVPLTGRYRVFMVLPSPGGEANTTYPAELVSSENLVGWDIIAPKVEPTAANQPLK